jgi:tetratricopeptide (TPR) repeat protein
MFKEAEEHLRRALERTTKNYTTPKDGEAYYYLGVALRAQGKYDEAYDAFYKATWYHAWHAAAYYSLAEIDCLKGNFYMALEHLERSLSTNTLNTKALDLKSTVLRKIGRLGEAEEAALKALAIDPLDFWAGNELYLIKSEMGMEMEANEELEALKVKMRDEPQSYLELATDYSSCQL